MKIPRCKGTRDWLPEEMARFRRTEAGFRALCLKWGYQEVRTPTIESLHLFTSAGTLTPSMLGRVYSFLDWDGWSGERVVLRPDGTIPIARLYIDRMADRPVARLFYTTNIFIFEETGKESRERWQCGAELIGAGAPLADTELVSLALSALEDMGVKDVQLRLSHAGVIKALLARLGLDPQEQAATFDRILDGDVDTLAELRTRNPEMEKVVPAFLNLKGRSAGLLDNMKVLAHFPEIKPHLENFMTIVDHMESLGCEYQIDIASGAGFEYYTGVIFQFFSGNRKIGGGGRYDNLIPAMGGGETPACGFALYLDPLLSIVSPEAGGRSAGSAVGVRAGSGVSISEVFQAMAALHGAGLTAEIALGEDRPKDRRWLLEVGQGAPRFRLYDLSRGGEMTCPDIGGVLKLLEAGDAAQNRAA
ncbi:MAG: HisS family protein [Chloroflexota bacterium]